MQDWKEGLGIQNILTQMNLQLSNNLKDLNNIFLIDSQRWLFCNDPKSAAKLWYSTKIPFSNEVFLNAAETFKGSINGFLGEIQKTNNPGFG